MTPALVSRVLRAPATALLARLLLTSAYWTSGATKLADFEGTIREVAGLGLPWQAATAVLTILVQLLGSAAVILNRSVWLGAGALGVFTLLATFVAHDFWNFPPDERPRQLATFLEHLGLFGGLVLAAVLAERERARA